MDPCGQSEHHGPIPSLLENTINPYIWCAVGGGLGWLGGWFMKSQGQVMALENIGVAVFGAFIGGEFVAAQFPVAAAAGAFPAKAMGFAVAGAVLMLVLLRTMRGAVGPMRPSKPKPKTRY